MIRSDQIPPEAAYEAFKYLQAGMRLEEAIAAAINSWPGAKYVGITESMEANGIRPIVILPLSG